MKRTVEEIALLWQIAPVALVLRREAARQGTSSVAAPSLLSGLAQQGVQRPARWTDVEWAPCNWTPEGHRQTLPPRGAGVTSFARQLMAVEKARMRRHALARYASRDGRKPHVPGG